MDDSLSSWLRLREPLDRAARSQFLTRTVADALGSREPVRVLDLGTGTGANVRYLAEHLQGRQHWLVVDRDAALLTELPVQMGLWGAARGYQVRAHANGCVIRSERLACEVETRQLDIGAIDDAEIFAGRHLVTASALLDLVSARWLCALSARCRSGRATALFAITYNGRSVCSPAEPDDELVRGLMNRHQNTDKGLGGNAEGPDAVARAERCFVEAGYRVDTAPSDWTLRPADSSLQRMLIEGWARAAIEMAPDLAARIQRWRLRRLEHVDAGRSHVIVGHDDICARLPAG